MGVDFSKGKSFYDWCLQPFIRKDTEKIVDSDMVDKITHDEFEKEDLNKVFQVGHPHKSKKYRELRMYGFVPYNISPIQKGIQFNHANDVYANKYSEDEDYQRFRTKWFTNIILNGGTTNEGHMVKHGFQEGYYEGSMQGLLKDLNKIGIKVGTFYEPDLNSTLGDG